MTEEKIYETLSEVFEDVFLRDDIKVDADLTAKDVDGWDSMRQIEIIMSAEERFGISFQTREIDSLASVGDLVKVILAKLN